MANRKIKVRYVKSYDCKTVLVSGIHGGIGSNGLLNANFFLDRVVIPDYQIMEIDEKAVQVGLPVDQKDSDVVREVQTTLLFDVNTARLFINWLESRIRDYEGLVKK